MTKVLAFGTALTLLLAGGLLHGLYAERWAESEELRQAAARLDAVPLRVGDWAGRPLEGDPVEFERAGARGYWVRSYTNPRTGAAMLAILMVGRAGKMAVHTPEVCYRGAGYDLATAPAAVPVRSDVGDPLGALWTARFVKQAGRSSDLRLFWGWTAGGPWQAAENPRRQFLGAPLLYKLYVSYDGAGAAEAASPGLDGDPGVDFLRQLLPALDARLFPTAAGGVN